MKINNYNDFLNEHYEFINEAMLLYTKTFKSAVNTLCKNSDDSVSKVANFLFEISDTDIDKLIQSNIGISDDVDKVTFIPANKIEGDGFKITTYSYVINMEGTKTILDYVTGLTRASDFKNYVSKLENAVNDEGLFCHIYDSNGNLTKTIIVPNNWSLIKNVSDMPDYDGTYTFHYLKNIENEDIKIIVYTHVNNYNDYPTIKANVTIPDIKPSVVKVGRFINKIIELYFKNNDTFKDYTKGDFKAVDVEKFVNAYTAQVMYDRDIESFLKIVEGDEIQKWYLVDNYQIINGQLGSSCMRHNSCQSFFGIYTKNPEVCKMLILTDTNDKLVARALLWVDKDGKKWIDRVYAIKDSTVNIFNSWASKNDYESCYNYSTTEITVLIKNLKYDEYPYVDSLCWKKDEDENISILSNKRPTERPFYNLQYTNGGFSTYS